MPKNDKKEMESKKGVIEYLYLFLILVIIGLVIFMGIMMSSSISPP